MGIEKLQLNPENGFINKGNQYRLKKLMNRARKGESVKLGFLGGSITQGCLATVHEKCYAYLTFEWWKEKYPMCQAEYINAGVGGTSSQYGVARVDKDLLSKKPDLIFIEFSVNDVNNEFFMETYESLIRHVYASENKPAVFLIHNIKYDDATSAEEIHSKLGKYYQLPSVSMKSTIYAGLERGEIVSLDVTEDNLHPNDIGHNLLKEVITYALNEIDKDSENEGQDLEELPAPLTKSAYEYADYITNSSENVISHGFVKDEEEKAYYTDWFKGGWKSKEKGAKIEFEVTGTGIAVQYRKTINKPAPIAKAIIDGDYEHSFILDANFDENWGDELHIDTILMHGENKKRKLLIEIDESHEDDKSEFYLMAIISSR